MEPLSEKELRTRRTYRGIAVITILVALAITIWMVRPPPPLDLRFLSTLRPRIHQDEGSFYRTLTFKQQPAEVAKLLDAHLNGATNWVKNASPYNTTYSHRGRSMPYITLNPDYGMTPATVPAASKGATKPAAAVKPKVVGTIVSIDDPRGVVKL